MFKSLLSVFFVFFFYVLSAQEADKMVVKNGKKYFSHSVVKGETIFRICKNYSVTSEQLIELNPSLSKGLQLGKPILIPYSEKKEFTSNSSIKFNVLVESTLSNVSSLFNLKEDELKVLNPNSPNQLLAGTQLNVPGDSLLFKTALYKSTVKVKPDTIIQYVIEEKDVLYSIAKRFMTSVKEIQTLNLKTNTTISPNSVLLIPIYDRRVLEMKFRTSKDLLTEQEKIKNEEVVRKIKELEDKKLQTIEENNQKLIENKNALIVKKEEKARLQKEESEKQRLATEQLKKEQLVKAKIVNDSISKVTAEKVRIQKEETEKQRLAEAQLKKEQLAKAKIVNDSISKVTAEKVRIQKEESEKKRLAAEQLKKEQLAKAKIVNDSIAKVKTEKVRIQKEETEKQRLAAEQLKKEQLVKAKIENDSIAKVNAEKIRIQKEESEKQRLAAEQLKKEQLAKAKIVNDSISKVTAEKVRIQKEESEKKRLAAEQLKKDQLAKDQVIKDSIAKVNAEKIRIQKEEPEKQLLAAEQLKKEQLAKAKIVNDSISKVTAEKALIQKEESEKKRLAAEQLKKEQLAKEQIVKDSIAKVNAEKIRIQKEESEKQRLAAEQLKKEQLAKDQVIKDSITKVNAEKIRIQKEETDIQRLAAERLKKEQLAKDQVIKDSIVKVTAEKVRLQKEETEKQLLVAEQLKKEQLAKVKAEKIRIQQEELAKQRIVSEQLEKERLQKEQLESQITSNDTNNSTKDLESTNSIQDSTQFNKKFVLTFLLPFNSDKQNDPTSKVATEFYMGVQLALDSLSKFKFKGKVNVLDCGNDTSKLNPLFLKEEVIASSLIIGPLNGINLIQTADFCNRNNIPMINPIMSNTALLKNNKFVYNAVSSEMSLVKGLAKYVYGKHTKDQVVLVKVGGKDEELYHEFRSNFSNQGSDKLYEVTDTSMLSVIKKDKKSIFVVLTRDKELATKISKQLTEYIDRNKLTDALSVYGTKDWLNFEAVSEEIKKKIDFKYNSSIDFNSNNQNLSNLRKKFKEKFKISLTKYAAQGYDVTFYFVKKLLLKSTNEMPMMNVFDLNRIEQYSGFENGGSYVFGYEEGVFKRIQVLND